MRKPRDFDSELKALDERARQLKTRKLHQLGELLVATGADTLPADVLAGALLSAAEVKDTATKEGWRVRGAAFFSGRRGSKEVLAQVRAALRRAAAARCRLLAVRARSDTRVWVVNRRERTRQLIELGGLVTKAGIVDLTEDDRAVIFGALLSIAATLKSERRDQALLIWDRNGTRGFANDQAQQ